MNTGSNTTKDFSETKELATKSQLSVLYFDDTVENADVKITKDCLKVEELADELQISATTVYRFVKERKIPFFKVGKQLRFSLEKVKDSLIVPSIEDAYEGNKK